MVAFLLYAFFRFVKGTKATSILVGLVLFFFISFISRWLDLKALSWIMNSILALWVVAFVIVFQPEIRNALARIGRQRPVKFFLRLEEASVTDEIIDAVRKMADDRIGALIVIQKSIGLKDIIDTGVHIEAPLLIRRDSTPRLPSNLCSGASLNGFPIKDFLECPTKIGRLISFNSARRLMMT